MGFTPESTMGGEGVGEEHGMKAVRPPTTIPIWKAGSHNGYVDGLQVEALISIHPGGFSGSGASYRSPLYNAVSQRKKGGKSVYVQGHLLNHHLHGTGADPKNLTPIPSLDNGRMERTFETHAKRLVLEKNRVIYYGVQVIYGSRPPRNNVPKEEQYVATALVFTLKEMKLDSKQITKGMAPDAIDKLKSNPANWIEGKSYAVPALQIELPHDAPTSLADWKADVVNLNLGDPIPGNRRGVC